MRSAFLRDQNMCNAAEFLFTDDGGPVIGIACYTLFDMYRNDVRDSRSWWASGPIRWDIDGFLGYIGEVTNKSRPGLEWTVSGASYGVPMNSVHIILSWALIKQMIPLLSQLTGASEDHVKEFYATFHKERAPA